MQIRRVRLGGSMGVAHAPQATDRGRPSMILPSEARPLLEALSPVFTAPTFARFVTLFGSAILCTGRRTVANLLRTAAPLIEGHRTTYQRVFSSAEWSALRLACRLARLVLTLVPADQPVILVGDDTVDG